MNLLAQGDIEPIKNPALQGDIEKFSGSGDSFIASALPAFVTFGLVIGSIIFLFVFIAGALGWMTSGGDKQKVESARGRITSALTGLVLLFVTFAIAAVIEGLFGVDILTLDIESLKIR